MSVVSRLISPVTTVTDRDYEELKDELPISVRLVSRHWADLGFDFMIYHRSLYGYPWSLRSRDRRLSIEFKCSVRLWDRRNRIHYDYSETKSSRLHIFRKLRHYKERPCNMWRSVVALSIVSVFIVLSRFRTRSMNTWSLLHTRLESSMEMDLVIECSTTYSCNQFPMFQFSRVFILSSLAGLKNPCRVRKSPKKSHWQYIQGHNSRKLFLRSEWAEQQMNFSSDPGHLSVRVTSKCECRSQTLQR